VERVIRRAIPAETSFLNELTERSVLSWGYEAEFFTWEPEAITVTSEFIANSPVFVLEDAGRIVAYYGLLGEPPEMALDKLFVEPDRIGTGCGKRLWQHAVATARDLGASVLTLASDPNAAPFYAAMGAVWVREEPTSRPGWALQMFRFRLPGAADEGSRRAGHASDTLSSDV
jgi:GNAT superfamily N-acetyltransferase